MTTLLLIFNTISLEYKLPPNLLMALCTVESSLNAKAVHKYDGDGTSYGMCQIKIATAKFVGFKGHAKELFDPAINVLYAAKYLKFQVDRYKGNYAKAITAYNKGHSQGHGSSDYLAKVVNQWARLQLEGISK